MARIGAWDIQLRPEAWFDTNALADGWFTDELLTAATGGAYTLAADGASYSLAGNNANLLFNRRLAADGGIFTYSGNNAELRFNRRIVADGGAYTYSGNSVNLTYIPGGAYVLTAEGGNYTYSGNNADLVYNGQQAPQFFGYGGPPAHERKSSEEKPRKRRKKDAEQEPLVLAPDIAIRPPRRRSVVPPVNVYAQLRRIQFEASIAKAVRQGTEAEKKKRLRAIAKADDEWLMSL